MLQSKTAGNGLSFAAGYTSMSWLILTMIGTVAFAASGAIIAMEEDYDILGIFILGIVTAFGGGAIRNLLIGVPVSALWDQGLFFTFALLTVAAVTLFPAFCLRYWEKWGNFIDAIGLAAFSIQGAQYAAEMDHPMSAIIVAAVLTGCGGGIIRDLLAGRKPLVMRDEIYAVWAILSGAAVGFQFAQADWQLYSLLAVITACRVISYTYKWKLPGKRLRPQI